MLTGTGREFLRGPRGTGSCGGHCRTGPARPVRRRDRLRDLGRPPRLRLGRRCGTVRELGAELRQPPRAGRGRGADRKSTRLNSSHVEISYAVFCLKKKKNIKEEYRKRKKKKKEKN